MAIPAAFMLVQGEVQRTIVRRPRLTEYSWNKELAYARAYHMGGESRTKGVNVLLGPVVGPLGRMAEGGRNWEGEFVGNIL